MPVSPFSNKSAKPNRNLSEPEQEQHHIENFRQNLKTKRQALKKILKNIQQKKATNDF
jgi:5-bromo-4-chloroindolyl phosphate hydrolysis protein